MDALQMPLFTTVTGRLDFYGWKPRGNESKHWLRVIWHKTTGVHSFDSSCNWRYSNMESIDRQQYTPSTLSIPPSTYLFNSFIHGRTWLDSYCEYTTPIPSWTYNSVIHGRAWLDSYCILPQSHREPSPFPWLVPLPLYCWVLSLCSTPVVLFPPQKITLLLNHTITLILLNHYNMGAPWAL